MVLYRGILILALSIVAVAVHDTSFAGEQPSIEQLVAQAKTAKEYASIAAYYEQAAQSARADLRRYEIERVSLAKQTGPVRHSGAVALRTASMARAERRAKAYDDLSAYYRKKAITVDLESSRSPGTLAE